MCIPRFVPTRESLYDFLVECIFVCLTQHRSYAAPCRFLFTLQGRTARFVGVVGLPILFRECFRTFLLRYRISSAVIAQSTCSTYPAGRLIKFSRYTEVLPSIYSPTLGIQFIPKNEKFLKIFFDKCFYILKTPSISYLGIF